MTATWVLAALAGFVAVAGAVLTVVAALGLLPEGRARRGHPRFKIQRNWDSVRWLVAGGSGLLAWAVTGWPALGLGVVAGVIGLPIMFAAGSQADRAINRLEALEEWTRRLADLIAVGSGLEQAIVQAARTAPAPIQDELSTLAARITARTSTEVALRAFADQINDPSADLVVASLILATRRRGPGVSAALTAIAEAVGEEVAARRRVEADRAKPRTTARAVTVITLGIVGVGLLNTGYIAPYSTPLGQIVLAATLSFFAFCLWWMHSMTVTKPADRMLASAPGSLR